MFLSDYTYTLPQEKIAEEPLKDRDSSKLLIYKQGKITHKNFTSLPEELLPGDTLFLNNTKVIPARVFFRKSTGAIIEIFLLDPLKPSADIASAMAARNSVVWRCLIGNFKKWKNDDTLTLAIETPGNSQENIEILASVEDRENKLIRFSWNSDIPFSGLIELIGKMPLPPYIKREVQEEDKERYQTVYRKIAGAVAAPTAGLHFTDSILDQLAKHSITLEYLTLHVSAGTFMPIKESEVRKHEMHYEQVYLTRENILALLNANRTIAVGTTSMRTMESLYWFGVMILKNQATEFIVTQTTAYEFKPEELPNKTDSLNAVLSFMDKNKLKAITGRTGIFIYPGYKFRICEGLVTNFHLPGSTLILLVAAFVGSHWRTIYEDALQHDYRFLSYGDSSLLIP